MYATLARRLGATALALAASAALAGPANAALVSHSDEVDATNGFPVSYTDDAGLELQQCTDGTAECTLAPDPPGTPDAPELFWWAASAVVGDPAGPTAELVLAMELAQDAPPALNFGRIQVDGGGFTPNATYTVTHPYGSVAVTADDSGELIRFREEIGCAEPEPPEECDPAAALATDIGPFLRWAPGGTPPPAGYIGDPAVPHAVVGSPTGDNFFRIEGPNAGGPGVNSVTQTLFSVMGKVADGAVAPPTAFDTWSPRSLSFGSRLVGTSGASQAVSVTNTGFGPLTVSAPAIAGPGYSIASNTCVAPVVPGGSCAVSVAWTPAAAGNQAGTLTIPTSSPNGDGSLATRSSRVVALSGTGTTPPPPPAPAAPGPQPAAPVATPPAGQPGPGVTTPVRPSLSRLRTAAAVRLRTARRRGLTVRFSRANTARVRIRVLRGTRTVRTLTLNAGTGRVRLNDRRLRRALRLGRYTLRITPIAANGARGTTLTRRVRIRR